MSSHPCRDECRSLMSLAEGLSRTLPREARADLEMWRHLAQGLLGDAGLESLDGEKALEILALDLRSRWLKIVHTHSNRQLLSPPHRQPKKLPHGEPIHDPYDRWIKPKYLEARLATHRPAPEGWAADHVVFSSGMSAISVFLQFYLKMIRVFWDQPVERLSLGWFGGYFEIDRVFRLLADQKFQGRRYASQKHLFADIARGAGDVLLIEPVAADWNLEVFDLDGFIASWRRRRSRKPFVIIVDTSLLGGRFPMERLCRELAPLEPALIVWISSGLKLDQEGLEFSNAGLLSLLAPEEGGGEKKIKMIGNDLRLTRTTLGAGLSRNEMVALDLPFFLDGKSLSRHGEAVFASNEMLAKAMEPGKGLFTEVVHPCLSPGAERAWAVSPLVNFRFAAEDDESRDFMRLVIEYEAKKRNFYFLHGSSFGFRGHRFEMGFLRGNNRDTFRVAMGSRAGPSRDGIIRLFNDLSEFPDFPALRAAYPMIGDIPESKYKIVTNPGK